jgi:hypothetical protein
MSKVTGLAWSVLSVDDASNVQRDIRTDVNDLQFATPRAVQDVTGIDKSAMERLLLLADCSITMNGVFDPASNQAHDVFKTVSSTSVNRLVTITTNGKTLAPTMLLTDYTVKRAIGGELTYTVPGVLANGVVPVWA